MLFQKRQDVSNPKTGNALGSSLNFEVSREFHIESIILQLSGTITAGAATMNTDGLAKLLKNVNVEVADGVTTRQPVNGSGSMLLENAVQQIGSLDADTAAALAITTGTGAFSINYPIFFAPPQIKDPTRSLFLLPAPRYTSNIQVNIDIASQAEIDTNGSATFAASAGITARLVINRRVVSVPRFPTFDTELKESLHEFSSSASNQSMELDVPGSYLGLLLRSYVKTTGARGDITLSNGYFRLEALGQVLRRARLADWAVENDFTAYNDRFTGSYYMDFLTDTNGAAVDELSSVLDANIYASTGAKLNLIGDIDGGTSAKIYVVSHRVFGDLRQLKLRPSAKK